MKDQTSIGSDELDNRFGFHKAAIEGPNATAEIHANMRNQFCTFAKHLDAVLPEGRAKSVAFTELENAAMWSHKALASLSPLENNNDE